MLPEPDWRLADIHESVLCFQKYKRSFQQSSFLLVLVSRFQFFSGILNQFL